MTYSREKDPKFFIFLERLEKAAEFKELDRVNGRSALDDFVTGPTSIQFLKIARQYEEMKKEFLKSLENGDHDPHNDRDEDFDEFVRVKLAQIPKKKNNPLQLNVSDRNHVREK